MSAGPMPGRTPMAVPRTEPDERPQEVDRRERDQEAAGELVKGVHPQLIPSGGNPGKDRPRSREKRSQQARPSAQPHGQVEEEPAGPERPRGEREGEGRPRPGSRAGESRRSGPRRRRPPVQNEVREGGRVRSASSASWGSKRSPRATATRRRSPSTTSPAPIGGGEEAGPDDGVGRGLGEGERAVEPDEAPDHDGDADPPWPARRLAAAAGDAARGSARTARRVTPAPHGHVEPASLGPDAARARASRRGGQRRLLDQADFLEHRRRSGRSLPSGTRRTPRRRDRRRPSPAS